MPETPRLWTFMTSPFAGKARAAFMEKGVDVELVEIHPARRPERLKELNPLNRVPVLEFDGRALRESTHICEWLEETYPEPPLWPADPMLKGWARGWLKLLDDAVVGQYFLGMRKLAFGKDEEDPEDIVERLHAKVPRQWPHLERALAAHDGPWLCGEQFTYADIGGMAIAIRLPQWSDHLVPDPEQTPLVAAWMEALRARPSAAAIDQKGALRVEA